MSIFKQVKGSGSIHAQSRHTSAGRADRYRLCEPWRSSKSVGHRDHLWVGLWIATPSKAHIRKKIAGCVVWIVAERRDMKQLEDKKEKFALYVRNSALDVARQWYEKDNCASISEFIEKAILFYGGYISNEHNPNYLPKVVVSTLKSIVRDSDNQHNKMLFKLCVEISLMMNVLATTKGIKRENLEKLRQLCEEEVRKTNGTISLRKALEWQD